MSEQLPNINLFRLPEDGFSVSFKVDGSFFADFGKNEVEKAQVDIEAQVLAKGERFLLTIKATGSMYVPCDRCLDLVEVPVCVEDTQVVVLSGKESEDDLIAVDEATGILELAPTVYDILITNLPLTVRHRQGECNPEMEKLLQAHLAKTVQEEPEE